MKKPIAIVHSVNYTFVSKITKGKQYPLVSSERVNIPFPFLGIDLPGWKIKFHDDENAIVSQNRMDDHALSTLIYD